MENQTIVIMPHELKTKCIKQNHNDSSSQISIT